MKLLYVQLFWNMIANVHETYRQCIRSINDFCLKNEIIRTHSITKQSFYLKRNKQDFPYLPSALLRGLTLFHILSICCLFSIGCHGNPLPEKQWACKLQNWNIHHNEKLSAIHFKLRKVFSSSKNTDSVAT